MAKPTPIKYFNCEKCRERGIYITTSFCTLRNNSEDEPDESSLCENIKICNYFKEEK